jgi:6-phosphogluconate dehydrogenase
MQPGVDGSDAGRWTLKAAIEKAVPADLRSAARNARFRSREQENFADELRSAMCNKFGAHIKKADR